MDNFLRPPILPGHSLPFQSFPQRQQWGLGPGINPVSPQPRFLMQNIGPLAPSYGQFSPQHEPLFQSFRQPVTKDFCSDNLPIFHGKNPGDIRGPTRTQVPLESHGQRSRTPRKNSLPELSNPLGRIPMLSMSLANISSMELREVLKQAERNSNEHKQNKTSNDQSPEYEVELLKEPQNSTFARNPSFPVGMDPAFRLDDYDHRPFSYVNFPPLPATFTGGRPPLLEAPFPLSDDWVRGNVEADFKEEPMFYAVNQFQSSGFHFQPPFSNSHNIERINEVNLVVESIGKSFGSRELPNERQVKRRKSSTWNKSVIPKQRISSFQKNAYTSQEQIKRPANRKSVDRPKPRGNDRESRSLASIKHRQSMLAETETDQNDVCFGKQASKVSEFDEMYESISNASETSNNDDGDTVSNCKEPLVTKRISTESPIKLLVKCVTSAKAVAVPLSPDMMETSNCDIALDSPASPISSPYSPNSTWNDLSPPASPAGKLETPASLDVELEPRVTNVVGGVLPIPQQIEDSSKELGKNGSTEMPQEVLWESESQLVNLEFDDDDDDCYNSELLSIDMEEIAGAGEEFFRARLVASLHGSVSPQKPRDVSVDDEQQSELAYPETDAFLSRKEVIANNPSEFSMMVESMESRQEIETEVNKEPPARNDDGKEHIGFEVPPSLEKTVLCVDVDNTPRRSVTFNYNSLLPPTPSVRMIDHNEASAHNYFHRHLSPLKTRTLDQAGQNNYFRRHLSPLTGGLQVQLTADGMSQTVNEASKKKKFREAKFGTNKNEQSQDSSTAEKRKSSGKKPKKKKRKTSGAIRCLPAGNIPSLKDLLTDVSEEDLNILQNTDIANSRLQSLEAELQQSYWEEIEADEEIFDLLRALKGAKRKKSRVRARIQQLHSDVKYMANLIDPESVSRAHNHLNQMNFTLTESPQIDIRLVQSDSSRSSVAPETTCPSYIRLPDLSPTALAGDRSLTFDKDEFLQILTELKNVCNLKSAQHTERILKDVSDGMSVQDQVWSDPGKYAELSDRIELLGLVRFRAGFATIGQRDPFSDVHLIEIDPIISYCFCDSTDCSRVRVSDLTANRRIATIRCTLRQMIDAHSLEAEEADLWKNCIDSVLDSTESEVVITKNLRDLFLDIQDLSSLTTQTEQVLLAD